MTSRTWLRAVLPPLFTLTAVLAVTMGPGLDAQAGVGDQTLDGERAVLVLRVQDGRFVELWSHHYDQQKMNRVWS